MLPMLRSGPAIYYALQKTETERRKQTKENRGRKPKLSAEKVAGAAQRWKEYFAFFSWSACASKNVDSGEPSLRGHSGLGCDECFATRRWPAGHPLR